MKSSKITKYFHDDEPLLQHQDKTLDTTNEQNTLIGHDIEVGIVL